MSYLQKMRSNMIDRIENENYNKYNVRVKTLLTNEVCELYLF